MLKSRHKALHPRSGRKVPHDALDHTLSWARSAWQRHPVGCRPALASPDAPQATRRARPRISRPEAAHAAYGSPPRPGEKSRQPMRMRSTKSSGNSRSCTCRAGHALGNGVLAKAACRKHRAPPAAQHILCLVDVPLGPSLTATSDTREHARGDTRRSCRLRAVRLPGSFGPTAAASTTSHTESASPRTCSCRAMTPKLLRCFLAPCASAPTRRQGGAPRPHPSLRPKPQADRRDPDIGWKRLHRRACTARGVARRGTDRRGAGPSAGGGAPRAPCTALCHGSPAGPA